MENNVHNYDKRLKSQLLKLNKRKELSKRNKELIKGFLDECSSQGLSKTRIYFYLIRLRKICQRIDKDLDKLTKKDIKELVAKINRAEYTEWTKQSYKVTIKKFYQWLKGHEWGSLEYPDEVKWIKLATPNNKKLPEDLLTKEEILM